MSPDDQPTFPTAPPNGSRPAPQAGMWQAPSVEQMQAILPQYEVIDILGRGGMGAVYKARQKSLKRLVAIKILPLGMADDEFKFAERFQNEAQTMAAMNHPAIVAVYDFGETADGLLYFIMEFVDGTDVQKMIQASGKLSGEYALAITAHVCDALDYAHKRGVIHRDIKPANILINQEGHVKVADFGLAKMSDPAMTSGLTKTNMAMGTPDYVAPEVLVTGMVADHRADIYAVGVMLYQMLTGEVPRGMFKLPSQKGLGSDVRFDEIICKAMEQDREERYQSAMDVRRDLDVILTTPQPKDDGTGIVSASQIPQKPVAKQPRPPGQQNAPAQNQPPAKGAAKQPTTQKAEPAKAKAPPKKPSPATMWLSIGGIVAVLGIAAVFVFSSKPKANSNIAPASDSTWISTQPVSKAQDNGITAASGIQAKTIDLLPLVDVKRDMIGGEWSRDGGDLIVKAAKPDANGTPRLQLPYQPPEEYDFEIEFTPESGTNMAGQALSAYQHSFSWFLDGKTNAGNKAGFDAIDGIGVASRTDGTTMRAKFLTNGKRHRSTVEVRRDKVRALLDGEPLVTWGSSPKSYERLDISKNEKMRDALHLGLIAYDRAVRFHKITVREVTGTGKVDAPQAAASPASYPPGTEYIDWLKSAAWKEPWSLEGGRLKSTADGKTRYFGVGRDGTVRVRFREAAAAESNSPPLQISFRGGPNGGAADRSIYYQLQIHPAKKQNHLLVITKDTRTKMDVPEFLWKDQPFPPSALGNGETELELRAVGQDLSLWSGATQLAAVRDARTQSGSWLLIGSPGVEITALVTSGITPNPGTISPTQAGDAPPQISNWQDVTATLREQAKAKPGVAIEGDLIAWNGDKQNPPHFTVTSTGQNDYTLRLTHVGAGQINVRMNEKGFIYVQTAPSGLRINRWMKGVVAPVTLSVAKDIPFSYSKGDPHDLTVTVQGSTIRAWLDGQLMGTVEDTTFAEGTGALALVSYGKVQKVEVAEPLAVPAASAAPPTNTNWQDVTDLMRTKARTRPELAVEPDVVRRAGTGTVSIPLTTQPVRNCAVRVRYTGEVEVDLRHQADGFVYVLATGQKTVFMRYRAGVDQAAALVPVIPHPAGFLSGKPHEFLVTMQGALIRAWLDGRFVGEVQDNTFAEGNLRLTWLGASSVQKVEIAELGAANRQSITQWTDWLAPKLATGTFGPPDWKVEKEGLTSEKPISGRTILPGEIDDAAVRVSYDLRDSAGIQVTMRERRGKPEGRELYVADDTGVSLYIARMMPDGTIKSLVSHNYPNQTPRAATRTLEFRCVGETLTATVTGATAEPFIVTATDTALQSGPVSVSLKKGVLLKKVEVADMNANSGGSSAGWQPIFNQPADFGGDLRDVEFRDGATFLKARTFRAPAEPPVIAIRSTLRYLEGDRTGSLTIRSTEPAQYGEEDFGLTAFIAPKGANLVIKMRDRPAGISALGRHDFPISPALKEGDLFTFELRAADKKITAIINGREVGSVNDVWTGATRRFGITPSNTEMTEFRDVAVQLKQGE